MKKQIGNRLITAASFVRPGSRVADIGTDHAYLPIYLAENKIAGRIIATDIKKG
ncbi:MAG: tRNA (adenine(22)-N(1))-methyltransferase TrmK, partial [Clostridia bacterium]|nr:tRNA (adenine(22)-N(1))-methyltransferase TrmK [Clostridia bacterium]